MSIFVQWGSHVPASRYLLHTYIRVYIGVRYNQVTEWAIDTIGQFRLARASSSIINLKADVSWHNTAGGCGRYLISGQSCKQITSSTVIDNRSPGREAYSDVSTRDSRQDLISMLSLLILISCKVHAAHYLIDNHIHYLLQSEINFYFRMTSFLIVCKFPLTHSKCLITLNLRNRPIVTRQY